jgi:hypothetical protein
LLQKQLGFSEAIPAKVQVYNADLRTPPDDGLPGYRPKHSSGSVAGTRHEAGVHAGPLHRLFFGKNKTTCYFYSNRFELCYNTKYDFNFFLPFKKILEI